MRFKKRSSVAATLALAGAAGLGYTGLRRLYRLNRRADDDFFKWSGPTEKGIDVGSAHIDLPLPYYRDDSFLGIFSAACKPVRGLLPSDKLHPVTLPGGRAALGIIAFNYLETGLGPYGEIAIVVPCTFGRPAPPLLPLALETRYPGWGAFILHLPVTAAIARDSGRAIWGYPKFVADMEFEKRPAHQQVRLAEGDAHILTLTVRQKGPVTHDNRPLVTYSVRGDSLIKTTIASRSVVQIGLGPGAGRLELGDHEIAGQLRALDVSAGALITRNYLTRCSLLPAGEIVAQAAPYAGRAGRDLELGRLTVRYGDGAEPIDLYAQRRA